MFLIPPLALGLEIVSIRLPLMRHTGDRFKVRSKFRAAGKHTELVRRGVEPHAIASLSLTFYRRGAKRSPEEVICHSLIILLGGSPDTNPMAAKVV